MVDDTYYITPHEAALALVATAMKKARITFDALVLNSILGGVVFCSGSLLYLAIHCESPELWDKNPGVVNFLGGIVISIGLFYVVILGADLYNSNILYFSVAFLRRAVSIWDVLISWSVSWLGNLAGNLFVSYVIIYLSGIGHSEEWKAGTIKIAEQKASFSFIQTFLKAIGGNFYVALAIYLQLLAKPLHVKFLAILIPIFTLVCIGLTHVVADEAMLFLGMYNGANVSVGKYIWKLLIPATIGNFIGGFVFAAYIPFYLHLVVVERDKEKLSLPEYDERDEQPELNVDSRVVRVPRKEAESEKIDDDTEDEDDSTDKDNNEYLSEKGPLNDNSSTATDNEVQPYLEQIGPTMSRPASDISINSSESSVQRRYDYEGYRTRSHPNVPVTGGYTTSRSLREVKTTPNLKRRRTLRSPPGVFPVRGMGEPLLREKTIENPYYTRKHKGKILRETAKHIKDAHEIGDTHEDNPHTVSNENYLKLVKTIETEEEKDYRSSGGYNVLNNKPGAHLERFMTGMIKKTTSRSRDEESNDIDSRMDLSEATTQAVFPHNSISAADSYSSVGEARKTASENLGSLFKAVTRPFENPHKRPKNINDIEQQLEEAGISKRAADAANTVGGMENYSDID
ncbi:Formate/nitrite transporter [Nakaseomyces glabratus]|nr:Formate/nitrite transporter [Nakaseomyces glabratus]KAH7584441.1 Formate/nitrite transporter [Nakaseomyces glabratus]